MSKPKRLDVTRWVIESEGGDMAIEWSRFACRWRRQHMDGWRGSRIYKVRITEIVPKTAKKERDK